MKARYLVIAALLILGPIQGYAAAGDLPDPKLTPGAWRDDLSLDQICNTAWGDDERLVTDTMKKAVMAEYHMTAESCPSKHVEIDHAVSRELGGADVMGNLWAECYEPKVLDPNPANTMNFDPVTHNLRVIDQHNPPPAYDAKKHPDGLVYISPSKLAEPGAHKKDRLENDFGKRICLPPTDLKYLTLAQARGALTGNWWASYISNYGDPRAQASK